MPTKIYISLNYMYIMESSLTDSVVFKALSMDISSRELITCVKEFYNKGRCDVSSEGLLLVSPVEGLRALDYISYMELEGQPSLSMEKFKNKLRGDIRRSLKTVTPNTVTSSISFLLFYLPRGIREVVAKKCTKLELIGEVDQRVLDHRRRVINYVVNVGLPPKLVESVFRSYMELDRSHSVVWLVALLASGVNDLDSLRSIYGDDVLEADKVLKDFLNGEARNHF